MFDPHIRTPHVQSWTFGIQRELNKDMVLEVRYVHDLGLQQWYAYNFNETNILANTGLTSFNSLTFGEVTSAYRDVNNTQDPGGRLIQFVFRFNF